MSRDNGSNQNWQEFSGFANSAYNDDLVKIKTPTTTADIYASSTPLSEGYGNPIATTGSLLVLEFGKDIQLPNYYAPGSLGSFNL